MRRIASHYVFHNGFFHKNSCLILDSFNSVLDIENFNIREEHHGIEFYAGVIFSHYYFNDNDIMELSGNYVADSYLSTPKFRTHNFFSHRSNLLKYFLDNQEDGILLEEVLCAVESTKNMLLGNGISPATCVIYNITGANYNPISLSNTSKLIWLR